MSIRVVIRVVPCFLMKATFPHFGRSSSAFKTFLEALGARVILPPPTTRRTMALGVRHAPEMVCLPFKLTLGNFIEALERGADTLFMAAGARRCRFGFYHQVQEPILRDLGHRFALHALDQYNIFEFIFSFLPRTFSASPDRIVSAVRILLAKSRLIEDAEQRLRILRLADPDNADRRSRAAFELIDRASTMAEISSARKPVEKILSDPAPVRPRLRLAIIGEIFLMLDAYANQEIEKELARLGVLVATRRSLHHYLRFLLKTDWSTRRRRRLARRYLLETPGGEAEKTVAEAVDFARSAFDGAVHIYPFTCMPENIALEALAGVNRDYGFPTLSLSFDEHTSRTGLVTRLEAFVELVERRKARNGAIAGKK